MSRLGLPAQLEPTGPNLPIDLTTQQSIAPRTLSSIIAAIRSPSGQIWRRGDDGDRSRGVNSPGWAATRLEAIIETCGKFGNSLGGRVGWLPDAGVCPPPAFICVVSLGTGPASPEPAPPHP